MNIKEINFGVESFSEEGLKSLNKGVRIRGDKSRKMQDVVNEAIQTCVEHNIRPSINLIVFYPEIDLSQLEETINNAMHYLEAGVNGGDDEGVKVNIATFIRAYFGADVLHDGYPTEKRAEVVEGSSGLKTHTVESRIFPKDKKMRELSRKSTEIKSTLEEEYKRKHEWQRMRAPKEVIILILFKSIYLAAEETGMVAHGHYQKEIERIDGLIEAAFAKEKAIAHPEIGKDDSVFLRENHVDIRSIAPQHVKNITDKLKAIRNEGLLTPENSRLVAELINFQKDLFTEQFRAMGEFGKYFEFLFHHREYTRFWHMDKLRKNLAMVFFLIKNNIDMKDEKIKRLLEIFGFNMSEAKAILVPRLQYYLSQTEINIGVDPDKEFNLSSDELRSIFEKALNFF